MKCGVLCSLKSSNVGEESAIDHRTGKMLAYVLAPHEDAALIKLKQLLHPFDLTHFYTDGWGAYLRLRVAATSHSWKSQYSED